MKASKSWLTNIIEFLIPATCLCCDCFIEPGQEICSDCDLALYPLTDPKCPKCALPRENREGINALCFRCISENRHFDQIFSAFEYEGNVKQIFSRAKYGRREDTIQTLARIAVKRKLLNLPEHLQSAVWISVPMHVKDLRARGFNSARLILDVFTDAHIASEDANLLKKTLPRVRGNTKTVREIFSKKAFQLRQPLSDEGIQSVVIVDDVMSSGATLSATAKCLKKAGVKNVFGVVLARNI